MLQATETQPFSKSYCVSVILNCHICAAVTDHVWRCPLYQPSIGYCWYWYS